jgi:serine/threonine-protein kinase
MREIKVQASLSHPNIAGLHTAQRLNNQLVMFMEFVEGVSIEQQLQAGAVSLDKGVEYISQVLSALAYAHARGVVHRDIKPANMMLTPTGNVKLMDFGIAKISADPKLTQTGRTLGSLYYMSPEQINGAVLDPRSDLYSLGVSLYEIVTGTRPFKGDSDFSIMAAHLNSSPVPPLQLDPKLPSMLNEIIMMSIAKDAAQRFQSADAFRNALQSLKLTPELGVPAQPAPSRMPTSPTVAIPPAAQVASSKPPGRRGLYMALGSLATIAVVVLAAVQGPKWFQSSDAASSIPAATSAPLVTQTPVAPQPSQSTTLPVTEPAAVESTPTSVPSSATLSAAAGRKPQPVAGEVRKPQPEKTTVMTAAAPPPLVPQPQNTPPAASEPVRADDGKVAALREHRELLMLLDTRANSVKGSLQTLQQQQARSGLNLRGDIVTTQQRMELYLNEAEASLKSGDPVRMKKNLDSAEREVEKLEKFLGR